MFYASVKNKKIWYEQTSKPSDEVLIQKSSWNSPKLKQPKENISIK